VRSIRFLLKLTALFLLSMLAVGLVVGCGGDAQNNAVLQIDDLLVNPRSFQNEVIATGTVTTFDTRDTVSLMGVVDNEHILMCRNLDCIGSKIYALNMSAQPNPQPGDVITMRGAFEATGDFWIFMISEYTVNNNIIELLQ